MSKRIVISILCTIVTSIILSMGTCKMGGSEPTKTMLMVQHPDGCFLLEPSPLSLGSTPNSDVVNVVPGKHTFKFDCNGKQYTVEKEVKEGEFTWTADPAGKGSEINP